MSTFRLDDVVCCACEEIGEVADARICGFRYGGAEAYVHFLHFDKRLDRWVPVGALRPASGAPHRTARTATRASRARDSDSDSGGDDEIAQFERVHRAVTRVRNIESVVIGDAAVRAWYFAPYPEPYFSMPTLYVCDRCFRYFGSRAELDAHTAAAREVAPPGREIYRAGNLSVFELHGRRQKVACQCLCLLAKLFLDHKTLYYDVEGFLFYVLCECDESGCHAAACFSKEVNSESNNALACIVVLPQHQRKGYGRLLISLSYELLKRQGTVGGPERPLSDLGRIAFFAYWRDTIVPLVAEGREDVQSVEDIERITAITREDVVEVLKRFQSVVLVKGEYVLDIDRECIEREMLKIYEAKRKKIIDPAKLIWFPDDEKE